MNLENDKFYLTKYPGPLPKGRFEFVVVAAMKNLQNNLF